MKASEIVAKFKEVLLSASDEVEMKEDEVKAESVSMEDFNALKADFAKLKGMVEKMANVDMEEKVEEVPSELESNKEVKEEVKEKLSAEPIIHTPEIEIQEKKMNLFSQNRAETTLERIFNQINKK
jgi:hypothetical protein